MDFNKIRQRLIDAKTSNIQCFLGTYGANWTALSLVLVGAVGIEPTTPTV